MASIYIDGRRYDYEFRDGSRNLLEVCLSLGLDVPYFCWHPAMGSVGACRQCAVKLYRGEGDTQGRIVMSCMTAAADGQRLSIDDPEVKAFRAQVIEWLMVNHPHDCPVCDEGGECHLQDMTVMTGHVSRRCRFPKRTFRNQNLGPFIAHEMNRCIQCYRCVRFYNDYAGGRDLGVFGWHDQLYFGRFQEGVLESPFSGNLVEVCPTGVFTDKDLKAHYVRPWDLQTAPSVCELCSLGCNTLPGERYGTLRRVRNRYNGSVNGYFLCDRGRYGFAYAESPHRLRAPRRRTAEGARIAVGEAEALALLAPAVRSGRVLGIGSPRASLESNFALRRLVGAERFFLGLAQRDYDLLNTALALLRQGPAPAASLGEVRRSDAVLLLGEDVLHTAPVLALALRQASRQKLLAEAQGLIPPIPPWDDQAVRNFTQERKGPFILASPMETGLEELATESLRAAPGDIARFGFAVARALDPSAPAVPALEPAQAALAQRAAEALRAAERPLVVSGTGLREKGLLQAAAAVASALRRAGKPAHLCFALPEANSLGVALLGAAGPLEAALERVRSGGVEALLVLENDLFRRWDRRRVTDLLNGAALVAVLDHLETRTTERAHLVLPAATTAESQGTLVNNEGRAQRFFKVLQPRQDAAESWRWISRIAAAAGAQQDGRDLDSLLGTMAREAPQLAGAMQAAPLSSFRPLGQRIPRQSERYTGRTAMNANLTVREPKPPEDPDSPLGFTMEGFRGSLPPALLSRFWAPGWNSVQSVAKFQEEVGGHLAGGDPGVLLIAPGTDGSGPQPPRLPEPFAARPGEFLVLPDYQVFGSEELSAQAPSVATRIPARYLGLAAEDARALGLAEGGQARLSLGDTELELPVRLRPGLLPGLVLLPAGFPAAGWEDLPGWGKILKGVIRCSAS
jgi:NADH-quinone oxidoreductase subunit G